MSQKIIQYFQQVLPMPDHVAAQLSQVFTYKELSKNDFLLKENQISNETYFLEEGYIRSYVFDTEGNEVTTAIYSPLNFADNFLSFFKRTPSKENFQALTPCKTWVMSYEIVQQYYHSVPEFREWGRLLLLNNYATLQERMLGMVQNTAEERYTKLIETSPDIFQNVSLKMLASYLGITDTSLSRIRKEFSKK